MSEQFESIPENEVRLKTRESLNLLELAYAERYERTCREILTSHDVSTAEELIAKQKRGEVPRSTVRHFADELHALSTFARTGEIDWNRVDWTNVDLVAHYYTKLVVPPDQSEVVNPVQIRSSTVSADGEVYVLIDEGKILKTNFDRSLEWGSSLAVDPAITHVTGLKDGRLALCGVDATSITLLNPTTKEVQYLPGEAKKIVQYDDKIIFALRYPTPSTMEIDTWDITSGIKLGSWTPGNGEYIYPAPDGKCVLIGVHSVVEIDFEMVSGTHGKIPEKQWGMTGRNILKHAILPDGNLVLAAHLTKDLAIYDPRNKKTLEVIEAVPQNDIRWVQGLITFPNGLFCAIYECKDGSTPTLIINPYTKKVVKEVSNGWKGEGFHVHPSGGFVVVDSQLNYIKKHTGIVVDIYGNKPQYK